MEQSSCLNTSRQSSHRTVVPTWISNIRTIGRTEILFGMLPDEGNMGLALNSNSVDPENMLYPVKTYDGSLLEARVCALPFLPPNIEFNVRKSIKEESKVILPHHGNWKFYKSVLRKKIEKSNSFKGQMLKVLKDIRSGNCQDLNPPELAIKLAMRIPENFTTNCKHVDELFFNGGGIHYHSNLDSTGFLLSSSGHHMNKLVLTPVRTDADSPYLVPNTELSLHQTFTNRIHQIVTTQEHEKVLCAVRFAHKLGVGLLNRSVEEEQDYFQVQDLKDVEQATDVCFSPYIPGEYVYVTSDGKFSIANIERNSTVCDARIASSPEVQDKKWSCKFSSTPRTLIFASGRHFILKDLRVGWQSTKNFFYHSYKKFYDKEKIRSVTTSLVSPYLHYVASDYQLTLFDSRYPNTPVLVWNHQLQGNPTYCQSTTYKTTSTHMYEAIVLGSRHSRKVAMFSTQHAGQSETISLVPTVHLSTPTDFIDALVHRGQLVNLIISRRTTAHLQGLQCVSTGQGHLSVLQQTDCGDVFYQDLTETQFNTDLRPKNLGRCFHPQLTPFLLNDANTEQCTKWIHHALGPIFKEKTKCNNVFKKRVMTINIMNEVMGRQRYLDENFNVGMTETPLMPPETESMTFEQLERMGDERELISEGQAPSFGTGKFDVNIDGSVSTTMDAFKNTKNSLMKSMLSHWDVETAETLEEASVSPDFVTHEKTSTSSSLGSSSNYSQQRRASISSSQGFPIPANRIDASRRPTPFTASSSQDSLCDLQSQSQTLNEIIPPSQTLRGTTLSSTSRSLNSVTSFRNKLKSSSQNAVGF